MKSRSRGGKLTAGIGYRKIIDDTTVNQQLPANEIAN
jgi:hypothetical protein